MSNTRTNREAETSRPARIRSNHLLAGIRLILLLSATLVLIILHFIQKTFTRNKLKRSGNDTRWTMRWGWWYCRLMGIEVKVIGEHPPKGCLIAPNHLGYADILSLASVVRCFFVAKADMGTWPLLGFLHRTAGHILVSRNRSRDLVVTLRQVQDYLREEHRICVFLEGTSSGGKEVGQFYSPLLQPAITTGAVIVPTAIRWDSSKSGLSISEDIAYWQDHVFVKHLWRLLGLRGLRAEIIFGLPIEPGNRERKILAGLVRDEVNKLRLS
jgi:1-acyl-sn-glycerol-3-phosphate acyltransferase